MYAYIPKVSCVCLYVFLPRGVYFFDQILIPIKVNTPGRTVHESNQKINNNVALAQDAKGREMIVFGKGIGFPAMPYELTDLSVVQRTFYDVDEKYFDLLRDVPQEIFLAADDIAESAREELNCPLNPNLTYVLADHLNFAIQRCREGIALRTPLAYDIRHLYPQEYELAHTALTALRE